MGSLRRLALMFLCLLTSWQTLAKGDVWLLDIKGAIGPATADYTIRGITQAGEANAQLIVLRIDTPGGLDSAMRDMIKSILASPVPIIGYVSPEGARAASAGTYLLYACHIAAMAPATNLGAATPVQIGAPSLPSDAKEKKTGDEAETATPASAMERKIINDAVAYIESLAQLRGRNIEWARKAVREGASLSAEDAKSNQVVDFIATDLNDLMAQIHGQELVINDVSRTLNTESVTLHVHAMDWRSEFLSVITDPNIAYMLMLIGAYGLVIEFSNPGMGVPGVVGSVCLIVALYAFQVLPISYAGMGLILLGIALMTAEAFIPSFGILGIGGVVSFVMGSIILMDTDLPAYQIAMPIIFAFATFSAGLLVFAVGMMVKARQQKTITGLETLIGETGTVEMIQNNAPMVRLQGELWQVHCQQPLAIDDCVEVTAAEGLVLNVRALSGDTK